MIEEIRIDNLGVIGRAHVELGPGLTVLTGETGAGKTMVLTALNLLLGGKADPATVRVGSTTAAVEGRVVLAAGGAALERAAEAGAELDDDGSLVLLRTVGAGTDGVAGRSRAYVGGRSVPQGVLAELADELVTVHGQADQARLRSPSVQREALDEFVGAAHREVLVRYRAAWVERARVDAELTELVDQARDRTREAELLRLGLAEVERVDPQPAEDVTLAEEVDRLSHAEDLRTAAAGAHAALVGEDGADEGSAAVGTIELARRLLEHEGSHDPALAALTTRIAEAGYLLADVSTDLAAYLEDLQADPLRLDAAQRRRAELGTLTRSYGSTVTEVLAWADTAGRRLLDLDGGDERIAELRDARGRLDDELGTLAEALTAGRLGGAERLSGVVSEELSGLAMGGAELRVVVDAADEPGPHGADRVEMLLVPHAGAPARPLGKGASGGELSRVMLAIEVALATAPGATRPGTFVFDEVDAGVGGRAAVEVGRRLSALAQGSQVLVVTHLAQVAAFADHHLVVTKSTADGVDVVTESDVRLVTRDERVRELARMLSGQEDSDAARTHAAELLELSSVGR
ncbi:DNA repair protein RecN [Cellulomonas humilata]|uniref:DNA repair protein RecN n=1 Tax=Cellulomonas humilata TaxID=144055 RepID=A0ABU0EIL1_9CELL|nr:DNA repair protein RecN [Cellulomonas humilata]MDQ0374933.1 DNA repair protein RecN (Recombination protein N) [Cellulomonas humilata]